MAMGRNTYDWAKIIRRARRRPGEWERVLPDVPARVAGGVRLRRHPALRVPDGRLEALLRQEYITPQGQKRGDVWLRFVLSHNDSIS